MRWVLRSKIHKAVVTDANVDYIGSITIDEELVEKAGLWPGEKVLVVSNSSGARLETYVLVGERNSGVICINGAAAHLIKAGEEIIVMGFELADTPLTSTVILVDHNNTLLISNCRSKFLYLVKQHPAVHTSIPESQLSAKDAVPDRDRRTDRSS